MIPGAVSAEPGPATDAAEVENRATVSRTTCGWQKATLERQAVRHYWRDVHSPAISRRAGVLWYRHSPFDPVRVDLFDPHPGLEFSCPTDRQIMWQSDVVYLDEAAVGTFMGSPADPQVTALLLADIEMIVDRSTTYRSVGPNLHTYVERTGDPVPMGPTRHPSYGLFLRARHDDEAFRATVRALSERWSELPGVLRLRTCLFDRPDMEAERRAGYPVKTHPEADQYQAWIDLVVDDDTIATGLLTQVADLDVADTVSTVHAYPVPATYTFVYDGAPTILGLRGFAAHQAIAALGADHAVDPRLLEWMYGPIAGRPVSAGGA
jgi:hypothetical protein